MVPLVDISSFVVINILVWHGTVFRILVHGITCKYDMVFSMAWHGF